MAPGSPAQTYYIGRLVDEKAERPAKALEPSAEPQVLSGLVGSNNQGLVCQSNLDFSSEDDCGHRSHPVLKDANSWNHNAKHGGPRQQLKPWRQAQSHRCCLVLLVRVRT